MYIKFRDQYLVYNVLSTALKIFLHWNSVDHETFVASKQLMLDRILKNNTYAIKFLQFKQY